jgi:2-polyprenyl-6-methoxyphenol hydroxylase-like FAD-dependent oxidoreductase
VLHAGDEQSLALVRLGDDRSASQVHARAIIVADGLQGGSLPALPSLEQRIARRAMIGIGTHIDASSLRDAGLCPPMQGHIAMHVGSVGYVGLVALPQGTIDLACALQASAHTMPRPAQVARVLSQALSLAQHSEASLLALFSQARWRGAPALHRSREPALGRTLLAGDAFAYVEPFSGEGMTWALLAGRLAGQLAGQLADQLADQRKESVALSPHAASTPSRGESPASPHANTSAASLAFVYRAQLRALLRARHARCRVLASVASAPWLVAGACAATRFAPAVGKLLGRTLASSWHAPLRSLA